MGAEQIWIETRTEDAVRVTCGKTTLVYAPGTVLPFETVKAPADGDGD